MLRKFVMAAPLAGVIAWCAPSAYQTAQAAQFTPAPDTAASAPVELIRDRGGGGGNVWRGGGGGGGGGWRGGAGGGMRSFGNGGRGFGGGGGGGGFRSFDRGPRIGGGGGGGGFRGFDRGPRNFGGASSAFRRHGDGGYTRRPWVGGDGDRRFRPRGDWKPGGWKPGPGGWKPGHGGGRPGHGGGKPGGWKPGDWKHGNWKHRPHHIRRHGRHIYWGSGLDFYYYDGYYYGNCEWLRERAIYTGSRYWWRRYELCRYYDW
jgi:hypothetical protein